MEVSAWRSRARFVAIVDIVLMCIGALFLVTSVVLLCTLDVNKNVDAIFLGTNSKVSMWATVLIVVVVGTSISIQMWASIRLFHAAGFGKEPMNAAKDGRIWENVTVISLVVTIIGYVISLSSELPIATTIIWRVIGLYVVGNFMEDLETHIALKRAGHFGSRMSNGNAH